METPGGMGMPYINVESSKSSDVRLYYESHGSGRPVVLVAAWPFTGEEWEKQSHALIEAGFRVIQYDRRGFGRSDRPSSGYDLETLVSDLHHIVEELDLRDAVLIGHSMGGAEVARYLSTYRNGRVRKAIYVAAVNPYLLKTADNPEGLDGSIFKGIQAALLTDRPATIAGAISGFYNAGKLPASVISKEKLDLDFITASQASPIATHDCVPVWLTDLRRDHEAISIPTLVIHGTDDPGAPIEITGARTALYPNSILVAVQDAPHGLNWTHAEQVNRAILEFIR
jgi:non-heme chloroperoxidase